MKITFNFNTSGYSSREVVVMAAFFKAKKGKTGRKVQEEEGKLVNTHWPKAVRSEFERIASSSCFTGKKDSFFSFPLSKETMALAVGLGEEEKVDGEVLRKFTATLYKRLAEGHKKVSLALDSFKIDHLEKSFAAMIQGLLLGRYVFDKYKEGPRVELQEMVFDSRLKTPTRKKAQKILDRERIICECVNLCRDLVHEPPNVLHSTEYAKRILADVKNSLKGITVRVLEKSDLKREKMGMFLSVNAGSAHPPKLVHLSYTPKKVSRKTKHIALVGKGLTFDTGGYSLKPAGAIINMKCDMAGSATVYAAFRGAVLMEAPIKISCFLGITDNAVNEHATMPDSIVMSRKGKTVEILNTDAEGRLVLGDVLDYASSQRPDAIIDVATLTGSCMVALGKEVCGLMGNDDKLKGRLKKAAHEVGESIWELPIIDQWREDMKSSVADLKNIGEGHFAGTAKAAAFLENFVGDGISWAHLDIAGVAYPRPDLSYCPKKGPPGLMVRTLLAHLLAS